MLIFAGPMATTIALLLRHSRKLHDVEAEAETSPFRIRPILTLAAFIIAILAASKLLQGVFGKTGLVALVLEVHGR